MGHLILLFLGTPDVRHSGQAVTFPTRKTLALLTYLAVEGGLHSREKLAALFWPESDSERGRSALRRTLAYLREALCAGDQLSDPTHLLAGRDALGFSPSNVESDLHSVQIAWARARMSPQTAAMSTEEGRSLIALLRGAAKRYRGDFLDGFSLNDAPGGYWGQPIRSARRWERQCARATASATKQWWSRRARSSARRLLQRRGSRAR